MGLGLSTQSFEDQDLGLLVGEIFYLIGYGQETFQENRRLGSVRTNWLE